MNKQEILNKKIVSGIELSRTLVVARLMNKKIVFTNGCFDIIHRGHIEYLMEAANQGDILIVGLNSDASVKQLKGHGRPVQDQETRAKILSSMFFVTYVVIFDEETPHRLISETQPDILVKGGDYKIENIVGYDIVKAKGGKVLTIPFVDGHSTTSLIQKLNK